MSLGGAQVPTAPGAGNQGGNVDPYDLSWIGIHNPEPTSRGPGGVPIYSGGSQRDFNNPFGADPSKQGWNSPFGTPIDQSSVNTSVMGGGPNNIDGLLQALFGTPGGGDRGLTSTTSNNTNQTSGRG